MSQAAHQERQPHDEQQIAQNDPDNGGLDQFDHAFPQRHQ